MKLKVTLKDAASQKMIQLDVGEFRCVPQGAFSLPLGQPCDQYFREVAETQVWRERHLLLCVALGASRQDLERHEQIVKTFAARTTVVNMWVWRAGWEMVYDNFRSGKGNPVIPNDVQVWADELWTRATGWDIVIEALVGRGRAIARCPQYLVDEAVKLWANDNHPLP